MDLRALQYSASLVLGIPDTSINMGEKNEVYFFHMLIILEQQRGLSTPFMFAGQPGLLSRMESDKSDPEKVYGPHSDRL